MDLGYIWFKTCVFTTCMLYEYSLLLLIRRFAGMKNSHCKKEKKNTTEKKLNSFFFFYFHSISINPCWSHLMGCMFLPQMKWHSWLGGWLTKQMMITTTNHKIKGTRKIIDLCIKYNVPSLIYTSTALVTL